MISVKIIYLIILIGCFLFYVLYIDTLSLVLLLFVIIAPIISFILHIIASKNIKFSIKTLYPSVSKKEPMMFNIIADNRGIIPISTAKIIVSYKNGIEDKSENFTLTTPIRSKNTQKFTVEIKSDYCGYVVAKIEAVRIYDLLHIFSKKLKFDKLSNAITSAGITVMPEICELSAEITTVNTVDYDSDCMSKNIKGDDPSDILDIHEYTPGDKLNRIHWKLSAKTDGLFVKDLSKPINNSICILFSPKIHYSKDSLSYLEDFDLCCEGIISLSYFLCEKNIAHRIVFPDSDGKGFSETTVTSFDECCEAIVYLMRDTVTNNDLSLLEDYSGSLLNGKSSRIFYFTPEFTENEYDYIVKYCEVCKTTVLSCKNNCCNHIAQSDGLEILLLETGKISKIIGQTSI